MEISAKCGACGNSRQVRQARVRFPRLAGFRSRAGAFSFRTVRIPELLVRSVDNRRVRHPPPAVNPSFAGMGGDLCGVCQDGSAERTGSKSGRKTVALNGRGGNREENLVTHSTPLRNHSNSIRLSLRPIVLMHMELTGGPLRAIPISVKRRFAVHKGCK